MAALFVVDFVWCVAIGLSVDGWAKTVAAVAVLSAIYWFYRRRSPSLAAIAESAALWVAFTAAACVFTYLCATPSLPLQDAVLERADRALGFDWLAWRMTVLSSPALYWTLSAAYATLMPQIVLAVLFFPASGRPTRGSELVLLALLSLLPTALISALAPALGPFAKHPGAEATFMHDLLAIRAPGPWHFNLLSMEGIVTMPSYHTVLAVLFCYAFRGTSLLGWTIVAINALMLPAIPPMGGHYGMDMIAGAAIAVLAIFGLHWVTTRRRGRIRATHRDLGTVAAP